MMNLMKVNLIENLMVNLDGSSSDNNEPFCKTYNEYSGKPREEIEYLIKKKMDMFPMLCIKKVLEI